MVGSDGLRSVLKSGRWTLETDILAFRCDNHFGAGGICRFVVSLLASLERVARRGEKEGTNEMVGEVGARRVSVDPRARSLGVGDSDFKPNEAIVEMRISLWLAELILS